MNAPGGVEIGFADLVSMTQLAKQIIDLIADLPEQATNDDSRRWAERQARSARTMWSDIRTHLAEGDPDWFNQHIRSTASYGIPMRDGPDDLRVACDRVLDLTQPLGADYQRVFTTLMRDDNYLPGVEDWLRDNLPRVLDAVEK